MAELEIGSQKWRLNNLYHIIDEQGQIEKVMPKVKPDTNAAEILEYLAKA